MTASRRDVLRSGAAGLGAVGLTALTSAGAEAATYPVLEVGARGFWVQLLQSRLSRARYWLGQPDGSFGGLTQQAVWALQKAAGLPRDGVVGAATWRAVNAGVRPGVLTSTTSPDRVEIHLARQLLKVVRRNALLLTLNTSTGSNQWYQFPDGTWAFADTPTGWYRVYYGYSAGWEVGPLGSLYRPRYFNSRSAIAVHGSGSVPPYPASHGCCRVSTTAMDMVWARNLMPLRSPVVVY